MEIKKYLGHFLLVVTIGFVGKQAAAQAMGGASASLVAKGYNITSISVTSAGQTGDSASFFPRISGDGRYVVFQSYANNLVDNDENGQADIFIYDRDAKSANRMQRISVDKDDTSKGVNGRFVRPAAISADGRYVVFSSEASNLIDGDTNGKNDVFLYDRDAYGVNRIERISVDKDDTSKGGNRYFYDPAISADGRYVVFASAASNLVAGDNNRQTDVFIYARDDTATANRIERISVDKDYTSKGGNGDSIGAAAISANGRYVVFASDASNLVAGDNNRQTDVFIYDRNTESGNGIERISVDKDDTSIGGNNFSINPAISADGRYVVFESFASNLIAGDTNGKIDIFIYDRRAASGNGMQRISVDKDYISKGGNGDSIGAAAISANGRYVVFTSDASNLVAGDNNRQTDVFIYDRNTESGNGIQRISVDKDNISKGGNRHSGEPAISADGRYVVFESYASNLVDNDENGQADIFIYTKTANRMQRINVVYNHEDDTIK